MVDARSGAVAADWRRMENNAAQFINTLGLAAFSEAEGEIDMPAASGARYRLGWGCRDKASCVGRARRNLGENCGMT